MEKTKSRKALIPLIAVILCTAIIGQALGVWELPFLTINQEEYPNVPNETTGIETITFYIPEFCEGQVEWSGTLASGDEQTAILVTLWSLRQDGKIIDTYAFHLYIAEVGTPETPIDTIMEYATLTFNPTPSNGYYYSLCAERPNTGQYLTPYTIPVEYDGDYALVLEVTNVVWIDI